MCQSKAERIETLEAKISALSGQASDDHLDQYRAELADLTGEDVPEVDTAAAAPVDDPEAALDTLKSGYSLSTLKDEDELERQIDTLRHRYGMLRHSAPKRAAEVRDELAALEALEGSKNRNWRQVRRTLEG